MPQELRRVMYVSKARRRMARGELADILAGARARNAEHGITGALIYDAGHFAQVLEGPPDAIEQLLENIAADPRHDEYTLISDAPVSERYFEGWAMDWADLGRYADTAHPELRAFMRSRSIADRDAVYRALAMFLTEHVRGRPGASDREWRW